MNGLSDNKIAEALEAYDNGKSLEEVLADYPGHEAELRPILETSAYLSQMRLAHSLHGQERSKERMLASAAKMRTEIGVRDNRYPLFRRLAFGLGGLVVLLFVLLVGIESASSTAIPGDVFYGPKRAFESIRLSLTLDQAARESLSAQQARERIREVSRLLDEGRRESVTFGGTISSMEDGRWIVAGLPVSLGASTIVVGDPQVGDYAEISGETIDGVVAATLIKARYVVSPEPKTEEPTPETEEQPTLEPTPTATVPTRPTATGTSTSTPTATPSPTSEMTFQQPVTPAVSDEQVTAEPEEEDGDDQPDDNGGAEEEDDSGPGDGDESDDDHSSDDESDDKEEKKDDRSGEGS